MKTAFTKRIWHQWSWIVMWCFLYACDAPSESRSMVSPRIDSLDMVILSYLDQPRNYSSVQFEQVRTLADSLEKSGFSAAALPRLTASGLIAFMEVDFLKALSDYLKALKIAEERRHVRYEGGLCQEIAKIHFEIRNIDEALRFERRAGVIWGQLDLDNRRGHSLNYLGMMHGRGGNPDSSLTYFQRALATFNALGDTLGMLPTIDQMARAEMRRGNDVKAEEYFEQAYKLARDLEPVWQVKAIHGWATWKRNQGEMEEALLLYEEGLDIAGKVSEEEEAFFLMGIGEVHAAEGRLHKASDRLEAALATFKKSRGSHLVRDIHLMLADIYRQTGDFANALHNFERYQPLHDSLWQKNNRDALTRAMVEHNSETKDLEIAQQRATILNQQYVQFGLVCGIFLLLVITGLIVWNFRQKQRANRKIQAQNKVITKTLEERESLLKEIHHRVKNNLQIIASLLYLQSGKFEDETIRRVLEEGQGRVRSMALIHQKLYESRDLKNIPFGEYVRELVKEIQLSFGAQASEVDVTVDVEQLRFDVDTAIPLGLIINELITNAFKYAFIGIEKPSLSISLHPVGALYQLKVQDNGVGIPGNIDVKNTKSLGLRLINALSEQVSGVMEVSRSAGSRFELSFKA